MLRYLGCLDILLQLLCKFGFISLEEEILYMVFTRPILDDVKFRPLKYCTMGEGSYAHHYTTNALFNNDGLALLIVQVSFTLPTPHSH